MPRFRRLLLVPPLRRSVVDREVVKREKSASPRLLRPELSGLRPDPQRAKCRGAVWRRVYVLALGRSPLGQSLACSKKAVSSHSQLSTGPCSHFKDRTLQEGFYPLGARPTA